MSESKISRRAALTTGGATAVVLASAEMANASKIEVNDTLLAEARKVTQRTKDGSVSGQTIRGVIAALVALAANAAVGNDADRILSLLRQAEKQLNAKQRQALLAQALEEASRILATIV